MDQTITVPAVTESTLFDNADAATLRTIDIAASIDAFTDTLATRINETYPDAEIRVGGSQYWADGFGADLDNTTAAANAQQLAEEIYNDGNLWMVER